MRFVALDSWRGVCALLVVLMHFDGFWSFFESSFVQNSYLFVDFFFVLSGFVITHGYRGQLGSVGELRIFVCRRLSRLWPLHATMLGAFVLLELAALVAQPWIGDAFGRAPFTESRDPTSFITNLLFIHATGIHDEVTWNYPSWSVSAEFCTYLVFGLSVLTIRRWMTGAAIVLATAGVSVIIIFYDLHTIDVMADYGLFRCIYGFFVGHLVYQLHKNSHRRHGRLPQANLLELGSVLVLIAFVCSVDRSPASLAAPLVFALVVYVFAFEHGVLSRFLKLGPLTWLGLHSYSIYMVHAFVLLIIESTAGVLGKLHGTSLTIDWQSGLIERRILFFNQVWAMDLLALAYLAAVIALAALSYRLIEVPGRELMNRVLQPQATAKTDLAVGRLPPILAWRLPR